MLEKIKEDISTAKKIPLSFHWSTFLLFIIFIYYYHAIGIVYCIIILFSILVHEYSHALMAIHKGLRVDKISVFIFGAGAFMDSEALMYNHKKGALIAAAGPIASFVLCLIGFLLYFILPKDMLLSNVVGYLATSNLILGVFNLLPLFPCDGGRLIYHAFACKLGVVKGVNIATYVSYILCGIGIILGILYLDFWIVFIFGLLIFMAWQQRLRFLMVHFKLEE